MSPIHECETQRTINPRGLFIASLHQKPLRPIQFHPRYLLQRTPLHVAAARLSDAPPSSVLDIVYPSVRNLGALHIDLLRVSLILHSLHTGAPARILACVRVFVLTHVTVFAPACVEIFVVAHVVILVLIPVKTHFLSLPSIFFRVVGCIFFFIESSTGLFILLFPLPVLVFSGLPEARPRLAHLYKP